ncbi:MAG: hypothetical protein OXR82_16275 [Gammaproteobacteria bacterium]|nr:hypothetical protein [Gammaproteobacteria bacterium]MDE0259928.1 hypothetical protein [Gammaproteobacteria bacterium]
MSNEQVDRLAEAITKRLMNGPLREIQDSLGSLHRKFDGLNDKVDLHYQEFRDFREHLDP